MGPPAPRRGDGPCPAPGSLELVQRAQAGDAAAFGDLYDRYVTDVHRYIAYRVPSRALAEDLTSEAFTRAWHRLGTFQHQGRDVGAWLVTIARNLVADHYKSSRYRLELVTDDVGSAGSPPLADGPEAVVLSRLRSAALLDAVRQLRPDQQECIALRFLQGMSVAETARIMGKNEGAIKALQYRAVKTLSRLLPQDLV
jgi:RNA polymerase sigma-70 factor (ECF subfamily)